MFKVNKIKSTLTPPKYGRSKYDLTMFVEKIYQVTLCLKEFMNIDFTLNDRNQNNALKI